ncbi:PREDICTED: uncharacterized protein LOC108537073 [Rhinopithecus bieti]|uniref:uncharacterized protein LOC108537073 n=1 Tax=Rhinopithecus bieti TaxID=61621 RepID=UPI00083C12DC|nr:PREDICTED: uncharacterized protein LOC108537073 [Rhinopithecus bieti]
MDARSCQVLQGIELEQKSCSESCIGRCRLSRGQLSLSLVVPVSFSWLGTGTIFQVKHHPCNTLGKLLTGVDSISEHLEGIHSLPRTVPGNGTGKDRPLTHCDLLGRILCPLRLPSLPHPHPADSWGNLSLQPLRLQSRAGAAARPHSPHHPRPSVEPSCPWSVPCSWPPGTWAAPCGTHLIRGTWAPRTGAQRAGLSRTTPSSRLLRGPRRWDQLPRRLRPSVGPYSCPWAGWPGVCSGQSAAGRGARDRGALTAGGALCPAGSGWCQAAPRPGHRQLEGPRVEKSELHFAICH